jgi:hypothetical protein
LLPGLELRIIRETESKNQKLGNTDLRFSSDSIHPRNENAQKAGHKVSGLLQISGQ